MKAFLVRAGLGRVETVYYADYESREDNLTFADVADGLNDRFREAGFVDEKGRKRCDLNVIVHSTGGLVIRHWLWRYYLKEGRPLEECPLRRLVMLAPAHFGSPLAHRGKSFLGALFKGRWKVGDLLEVGRQLLDGLELGSPYQWTLARRDLLRADPPYRCDAIQTTILVGIEDYSGLRGWLNKPGTDGVVVIAGTTLNCAGLILECAAAAAPSNEEPVRWMRTDPPEDFAWAVLPGFDHGSLVDAVAPGQQNMVTRLLLQALRIRNAEEFQLHRQELAELADKTYSETGKPRYQQFLLRVVDDQDVPVRDWTVEFFVFRRPARGRPFVIRREALRPEEQEASVRIQRLLTAEFHTHSVDPAYRRLLVDVGTVQDELKRLAREWGVPPVLSARVHVPRVDRGIEYRLDNLQNVVLHDAGDPRRGGLSFFYPNTTTLVELRVDRMNRYVRLGTNPVRH
ncbi:MAG: hypothetical protein NZM03_00460 [Limisphaera sp.]|nr:hypothetical protein [Limisphaera sp.]